jgi:hypothetical protein
MQDIRSKTAIEMPRLAGKATFITGAGTGIGRATTLAGSLISLIYFVANYVRIRTLHRNPAALVWAVNMSDTKRTLRRPLS